MLTYSTFVAPPKHVVFDEFAPGETRRTWSPTTATLIRGERDAVLVDPLMTRAEGAELAAWIAGTGMNLTTIFVTHGHGDHFFGAAPVLDAFPAARVVALPSVVVGMQEQLSPRWLEGFWRARFPGQLPDEFALAEPLDGDIFTLEGEDLVAIDLGHTDRDSTSALHVPSIGLVVAGDAVYGEVHPYLVRSVAVGVDPWLAALDILEGLDPDAVVAGHAQADATDDPLFIDETRRYLETFAAATAQTANALDLYNLVLDEFPHRMNRGILWDSARAVKGGNEHA